MKVIGMKMVRVSEKKSLPVVKIEINKNSEKENIVLYALAIDELFEWRKEREDSKTIIYYVKPDEFYLLRKIIPVSGTPDFKSVGFTILYVSDKEIKPIMKITYEMLETQMDDNLLKKFTKFFTNLVRVGIFKFGKFKFSNSQRPEIV